MVLKELQFYVSDFKWNIFRSIEYIVLAKDNNHYKLLSQHFVPYKTFNFRILDLYLILINKIKRREIYILYQIE